MYEYPIVDNYLSSLCCFIILQRRMENAIKISCYMYFTFSNRNKMYMIN